MSIPIGTIPEPYGHSRLRPKGVSNHRTACVAHDCIAISSSLI
ncbi:hypothetical protein [Oceanisphaera marina]|nr:hypothetical protein [Oceanisphaera marina]